MGRIDYKSLGHNQKKIFNIQKISSVLADYGFEITRCDYKSDGFDFIAQHFHNSTAYKAVMRTRLRFEKRYSNKGLHLCFQYHNIWYMYDHDELFDKVIQTGIIKDTDSWEVVGNYNFPKISPALLETLEKYKLSSL